MAEINGNVTDVDFCTLGMFIIDDIYPPPSAEDQTPRLNIIGGAGTYSAIGARLFSPPPSSKSVGWIVDAGTDFPPELETELISWETSLLLRPREGLTTRGWNGYTSNDQREFKYLTEKNRLTPDDLTPDLLRAKSFHLICSPSRCIDMCRRILERRREAQIPDRRKAIIIWEPVPDTCVPAELPNLYKALQYVDVISPNHEELASLFNYTHPEGFFTGVDKAAVERQSNQLLARGIGPARENGAVVVRVGREGCFVASLEKRRWLPAYYHHHQDSTNGIKVVDPTGGGNGFLGGFAVGLVRSGGMDIVEAARWGTVAASFCIEQVGVPSLRTVVQTRTCKDEVWNEESVFDRLEEYRRRTV